MKMAMEAPRLYPHFPHASHSLNNYFSSGTSTSRMRISFLPSHSTAQRHRFHYFSTSAIDSSSRINSINTDNFIWEDVFQLCDRYRNLPFDLKGFSHKIRLCNRNSEMQFEFMPFIIEDQIVGYVHHRFADHLKRFKDVFIIPKDESPGSRSGYHVTLHSRLRTPEDRTRAIEDVVKCLGEKRIPALSRHCIFWRASVFLIRTCSRSVLWNKGLWCSHEWLHSKRWREIFVDREEK